MKKLVVISDTHSKSLPEQLIDELKSCDLIVHAGDFCLLEDLENLRQYQEIKAVSGNMDDADITNELPDTLFFEVEGCNIGLCHGRGSKDQTIKILQKEFKSKKLDLLIFGHLHKTYEEKIGNTIYFNPGSPTDKVFASYRSYGVVTISDKGIDTKIVKLEE